ncbi:hypothetical protein O6H91_Y292400 [Diphasiastrum complanatum]|nr:hypothetical protein O6H91_Y292400 [Diphasiastrum complanatum]
MLSVGRCGGAGIVGLLCRLEHGMVPSFPTCFHLLCCGYLQEHRYLQEQERWSHRLGEMRSSERPGARPRYQLSSLAGGLLLTTIPYRHGEERTHMATRVGNKEVSRPPTGQRG